VRRQLNVSHRSHQPEAGVQDGHADDLAQDIADRQGPTSRHVAQFVAVLLSQLEASSERAR